MNICASTTVFGWWASSWTLLVCCKWFQKCVFFVWSVYSPSPEAGHVYCRSETLYTVLKFAHHPIWCLCTPCPPFPVLIAGLYNCTDDWAPQTVWQATTTEHTQMSGSLNFTWFLILLWMIKGASPIITHEKCTQPSVWTNWGSFVCFAFSQCRNLMFSPLELGLAFVSYLLTSTSFGSSWWPAAGLQLHIWPLLPLQSADGLSHSLFTEPARSTPAAGLVIFS